MDQFGTYDVCQLVFVGRKVRFYKSSSFCMILRPYGSKSEWPLRSGRPRPGRIALGFLVVVTWSKNWQEDTIDI
jgi:hypothetical protein